MFKRATAGRPYIGRASFRACESIRSTPCQARNPRKASVQRNRHTRRWVHAEARRNAGASSDLIRGSQTRPASSGRANPSDLPHVQREIAAVARQTGRRGDCRAGLKPAPTACNADLHNGTPGLFFTTTPAKPLIVSRYFSEFFVFGKTTLPLAALPDCLRSRHDFDRRDRPTPAASRPIHNVQHRDSDIGTISGGASPASIGQIHRERSTKPQRAPPPPHFGPELGANED